MLIFAIIISLTKAGIFAAIGLITDLNAFTGIWAGLILAVGFGACLIFVRIKGVNKEYISLQA